MEAVRQLHDMLRRYERLAQAANPGKSLKDVSMAVESWGLPALDPFREPFSWWHHDPDRFRVPASGELLAMLNLATVWAIWAGFEPDIEELLRLRLDAWGEVRALDNPRLPPTLASAQGNKMPSVSPAGATERDPGRGELPGPTKEQLLNATAAEEEEIRNAGIAEKEQLLNARIAEEISERPQLAEEITQLGREMNDLVPSRDITLTAVPLPPPARHRTVQAPPPAGHRPGPPAPPPTTRPAAHFPSPTPINVDGWFSEWLQRHMTTHALSISEVADQLGVTRAAVSAWVQGRAQPRAEMIKEIIMLLAVRTPNPETPPASPAALPCWQNGAAVLIGVSAYREMEAVPSIANNLTSLKEVMADGLGIPDGNLFVVSDPAASTEVHETIEKASEAADPASGALLVYFAGHGWTHRGRLMLGLAGSSQSRQWSALDFNHLRIQIADSQIGSRVVILDSCYSGAALDILGPDDLASAAAIDGTYVLTAANATTAALAPTGEQFTTFTGLLIRALTDGIPEGPSVINTEALYRYIERAAKARALPLPGRQIGGDGDRVEIMPNRWRGNL
ncbi:caspase family protein [Streptomyces sp. LARHCF249]